MFTGIVETIGIVEKRDTNGSNISFWINSSLAKDLKVDQSLAHDGVCLTIEALEGHLHKVTAVQETLQKTSMAGWEPGKKVNLERAMVLGGRLDGHLVQGHVDAIGTCISMEDKGGSWLFRFSFPKNFAPLVIEKGSICINGISLTAFQVARDEFYVTIIPYTYEHTNMQEVFPGSIVNFEFDMLGKYIVRMQTVDG